MSSDAATLEHITLASGGVRDSPRDEVEDAIIELVRSAIRDGDGSIAQTGWRVRLGARAGLPRGVQRFDLEHEGLCVVRCWLCTRAAATNRVWDALEEAKPPGVRLSKPTGVPWLAAGINLDNVAALMAAPELLLEAGDLERVVAWALIGADN